MKSFIIQWLSIFFALSTSLKVHLPEWPITYKACVYVQTEQEYIPMGWYVDGRTQRMRLDSYGIPEDSSGNYTYAEDDFEYACSHLGRPLYTYLYHYDNGKEYDIFPAPKKPYQQCTTYNISAQYPFSPLLPGLEFIEQATDNFTTYNHWRTDYFLFTNDYFFHVANGLPYKVYVDGMEKTFVYIENVTLDEKVFLVPDDVVCKTG
ncbi:uncharacterized protein LOC132558832 [Ylistrum balloti]|uniref:uncharacterized protein LOC132558832 n=1 Tax=Ylistrum balloti TaxID=509963 RepID=UPI002905CF87|nr:uncharacterized protein LOC132558832 [Ylistrum balloti]